MPNFESISIIGHIGRDAEVKATRTGTMVCSFSVAVSRRGKDKEDTTNWYRVSIWREWGEKLAPFLVAGKQVFVMGTPSLNTYTDKQGEFRASFEIMADTVQLLGRKEDTPDKPQRRAQDESIPF